MVNEPKLYLAKVMHKRLFPKRNAFHYGVYYLALPLPAAKITKWFASFSAKDVGKRDGSDPLEWARTILSRYDLNESVKSIVLVTMPRVLGYVFNPVSFYLCFNKCGALAAVLCEVHNTFGEQHTYLCAHPDGRNITGSDWLESEKVFHVSPFLDRAGSYKFRFDVKPDRMGIWIDYYNEQKRKQLVTSLVGQFKPLNKSSLRVAFLSHPLVALKAIMLIHWQALRLVAKKIKYIKKPEQMVETVSATHNLNKM